MDIYSKDACAKFINLIESLYQESQTKAYLIGGPKDLVDALFEQLIEYQIIVKIYDLDLDYDYYTIIGTDIRIAKYTFKNSDIPVSDMIYIIPVSFPFKKEPEITIKF